MSTPGTSHGTGLRTALAAVAATLLGLTLAACGGSGGPWPLPKGDYVLYYLLADGYKWVARTEFRVK